MKNLFLTLLFMSVACIAQTKDQLIESIIEGNVFDCDCVGGACQEGPQYTNFNKLKILLNDSELKELVKHRNGVVRMFASRELIETGKADASKLLIAELDRYEMVETYEGCIMDQEWTYTIIYYDYWNKIRIEAIKGFNDSEDPAAEEAMSDKVKKDATMREIDSIVISSNKDLDWLVSGRALSNRKFDDKLLPHIEYLAFKRNNSAAFTYLNHYYSKEYQQKFRNYWIKIFPNAKFDANKENDRLFFVDLIEMALDNPDTEINNIAVKKVKKENWMKKDPYRLKKVFNYHGIKY